MTWESLLDMPSDVVIAAGPGPAGGGYLAREVAHERGGDGADDSPNRSEGLHVGVVLRPLLVVRSSTAVHSA